MELAQGWDGASVIDEPGSNIARYRLRKVERVCPRDWTSTLLKRSSVVRTVLCRSGINKKLMVHRGILRSSFHLLSMLNRP